MKRGAVAGRASAASFGRWATPPAILSSAEASHRGWPQISAPSRSAAYSREREIAIWITAAARGATRTSSSVTTMLGRSRPPPNIRPRLTIEEIAPAIVAATVMVSVSRLRMWASSWAMTPASSSRERICMSPVVTATADRAGLRPVAKALGCDSCIT